MTLKEQLDLAAAIESTDSRRGILYTLRIQLGFVSMQYHNGLSDDAYFMLPEHNAVLSTEFQVEAAAQQNRDSADILNNIHLYSKSPLLVACYDLSQLLFQGVLMPEAAIRAEQQGTEFATLNTAQLLVVQQAMRGVGQHTINAEAFNRYINRPPQKPSQTIGR